MEIFGLYAFNKVYSCIEIS